MKFNSFCSQLWCTLLLLSLCFFLSLCVPSLYFSQCLSICPYLFFSWPLSVSLILPVCRFLSLFLSVSLSLSLCFSPSIVSYQFRIKPRLYVSDLKACVVSLHRSRRVQSIYRFYIKHSGHAGRNLRNILYTVFVLKLYPILSTSDICMRGMC